MSQKIINFENFIINIIEDNLDFFSIYDELVDDNSVFIYDRHIILEAFKNLKMFSLFKKEGIITEQKNIYSSGTKNMIPCFVILDDNDDIVMIWIHSRLQGNGIGTFLVGNIKPKKIMNPLSEAMEFWKKLGFKNLIDKNYLTK